MKIQTEPELGNKSKSTTSGGTAFKLASRTALMKPSAIREILKVTERPDVISFAGGLPAPELFPVAEVAAGATSILAREGAASLQYGVTEGYGPLREWVAAHVRETSGLAADAVNALVTNGSQQGLDLVAKVLIDPGDTVLVEDPAYLGALQVFRSYQAHVVGLRSDEGGLVPEALREYLQEARASGTKALPKFLYIIPNFQNPTGISLAKERREEIARIAAEAGLPIVEDDPYGSLRFEGESSPAISSYHGVPYVYLGSASKILAPGLRVAWTIASDAAFYGRLVAAKQAVDLHTSSFTQRLVWEFVSKRERFESHIRQLRAVYGKRRAIMLAALERYMPEGCRWSRPQGGMFLWVTLPTGIDTLDLLRIAGGEGIAFVPGAPFAVNEGSARNALRLNFSNASEAQIEIGIERLARVVRGQLPANTHNK